MFRAMTVALAAVAFVAPRAIQAKVEEIRCPDKLEATARDTEGRTWTMTTSGPLKNMSMAAIRGDSDLFTRIICSYTDHAFMRLDRGLRCELAAPNGEISRVYGVPKPEPARGDIVGHINVCSAKAGSPQDCLVRCEE